MKISAFMYNGEAEMLRLHIGSLHKHIDRFFIVESRHTFSGKTKPLYYETDKYSVQEWKNQITYHVVNDDQSDYWDLAYASPNTLGADHWKREFVQKESIRDALRYLSDDDLVILGDVDEIWDPRYSPKLPLEKLRLRVYAYYLDNRSSEVFWGPLVGRWGLMKGRCLNHLRSDISLRNTEFAGWHFTSQGGYAELKRKLGDSYSEEDYFNREVQNQLSLRHAAGIDFLGREFSFTTDESEWPTFLRKHRSEYAHLCRGVSRTANYRYLHRKTAPSSLSPVDSTDTETDD